MRQNSADWRISRAASHISCPGTHLCMCWSVVCIDLPAWFPYQHQRLIITCSNLIHLSSRPVWMKRMIQLQREHTYLPNRVVDQRHSNVRAEDVSMLYERKLCFEQASSLSKRRKRMLPSFHKHTVHEVQVLKRPIPDIEVFNCHPLHAYRFVQHSFYLLPDSAL